MKSLWGIHLFGFVLMRIMPGVPGQGNGFGRTVILRRQSESMP